MSSTKKELSRSWRQSFLQGLIPGIISVVVLGIITYCGVILQIKQNRQTATDLTLTQITFDILKTRDTARQDMFDIFVSMISDTALRNALIKEINQDPFVSTKIKQELIIKHLHGALGVQIIYLNEDSSSLSRAIAVEQFLKTKGYDVSITPLDRKWYTINVGKENEATVRHSAKETDFATQVFESLSGLDSGIKFRLWQIEGSQSPYSISIVLPDAMMK